MQFAYNLTRKESSATISVIEVMSIFGKSHLITEGLAIPTFVNSFITLLDDITSGYRTEFSRSFSNEKFNYMCGFDTGTTDSGTFDYSIVFYNATDDIYYSIMNHNIQIQEISSSIISTLSSRFGISYTGTDDKNIFMKSCVLEVH